MSAFGGKADVTIDNSLLRTVDGVDQGPGMFSGFNEAIPFTAKGTSAVLLFTQATPTGSEASPIIDNIEVLGPAPLPTALPLFATGLGGLGLLGWRRKRRCS
jgi:hypothetical protein